jgi:hypothetical protein
MSADFKLCWNEWKSEVLCSVTYYPEGMPKDNMNNYTVNLYLVLSFAVLWQFIEQICAYQIF